MSSFMLELIGPGQNVVGRKAVALEFDRQLWSVVTAYARELQNPAKMRIRVLDSQGGIVVLTGASAALRMSQNHVQARNVEAAYRTA